MVSWKPGQDDSANLLGTCRTLDGCDGVKTLDPYDPGLRLFVVPGLGEFTTSLYEDADETLEIVCTYSDPEMM